MDMEWKYYVYELIDPRDDSVFYVGKGTGDRLDQHEKETAKGVSSKKCNKIRSIESAGFKIRKRKVASFFDEHDAYAFEAAKIVEYGKASLTNVAPLPASMETAKLNPLLSDDWMRCLAIGFRYLAGYRVDYTHRPFAAALMRSFMGRFSSFVEKTVLEIGEEEMLAGLRKQGVVLQWQRA
jgi:hypothetical protein